MTIESELNQSVYVLRTLRIGLILDLCRYLENQSNPRRQLAQSVHPSSTSEFTSVAR